MPVFRCNKCGYLGNAEGVRAGEQMPCPKCQTSGPVYETLPYIQKLLDLFFTQKKQLQGLQAQLKAETAARTAAETALAALQARLAAPPAVVPALPATLSAAEQEILIQDWFMTREARIELCPESEESTEFFAQIADELGSHYALLREISDTIRVAQQKNLFSTGLSLAQKPGKLAGQLNTFCQKLYAHAFIAKYAFQQDEKVVRLGIQKSPEVQRFFEGEWLQWFAFTRVLRAVEAGKNRFAGTRQLGFARTGQPLQVLDVFFLVEDRPLCIQCLAADALTPDEVAAAQGLRQALGLDAAAFVLCVSGLSADAVAQASQQSGLNVVNPASLANALNRFLRAGADRQH